MLKKTIVFLTSVIVVAGFITQTGCAPKCTKIISAKTPEDLHYEDGVRINDFVKRREAAMKEAEGGNMYTVEEAQRTVTACQFAIHMMVRTQNLYENGNPLYESKISEINESRCFLDDVLATKGKLIGKGKDSFLSAKTAGSIRSAYEKYQEMFGNEGVLSERALNNIYNKGVKAKKKSAPGKEGQPTEEDNGATSESSDDNDEEADEGSSSSSGAMDSF